MTLFVAAGAAGWILAAPHRSEAAVAETVAMTNTLEYEPRRIRIGLGDTVRWNNTSDLVHTVTADPELASSSESVRLPEGAEPFNSGRLEPGDSWTHTFRTPGTYKYFCIPHEGADMYGWVEVQ